MSVKVAINGFGRIGRLAFRQMFGAEGYEVVAINDLTSAKMLAHLLKYDSTQGNYVAQGHTVDFHEGEGEDNYIVVDGKKIVIYKMPNAADLPWGKLGVDVVLECTGFYTSKAKAQAHIDAGARKVVISAPAGNDLPTIVFNVMSVSDVVKDKKEARKAIGAGYLITILLMVCLIFTLFSYTNVFDVCAETLPVMSVLNRLGMKWLQWLYVILMTLAVLTSAAGLAHAGNVRFDGLFRFIKNAQLRRFVITAILLGIAAVGAALGFQAMLQQGTSIVGWAAIPIVVIPAFTIVASKVRKAK